MSLVSPLLRRGRTGYFHWCPACEQMHPLPDSWTFDGDVNKPTFSPSFKHTLVHWPRGVDAVGIGRGEKINRTCHYIITAGMIQFCRDSWHGRSDIVAMPAIPLRLAREIDDGFQISRDIETQD